MLGTANRIDTIVHIGKFYPPVRGGMENFLSALCRGLGNLGCRNLVLVHEAHRGAARGDSANADPTDAATIVYRAGILGTVAHTPLSVSFPFHLNRLLARNRVDVIHVHMPNASAFWLLLSRRAVGVPWIVHWHSDVVASKHDWRLKLFYPFYRPFETRILSRAAVIIATSEPYLASSRPLARWHAKCRVVPLGIDSRRPTPPGTDENAAACRLWGDAQIRVLCIARLAYYKGVTDLIEAASSLVDTRVVIVGTGEQHSTLLRRIDDLGVGGQVVLAGSCSDGLKSALLQTCTCLCLPSIERTEAFGLVLLEAMAHARPVVACDVPGSGVGWVVRHGESGYKVPVGRPRALADAIARLASDRERADRMGLAGRQRLTTIFSIERSARMVLNTYHDAISKQLDRT